MILPYMSEEFHDETCYIDEAHGDGLVVVFEGQLPPLKGMGLLALIIKYFGILIFYYYICTREK